MVWYYADGDRQRGPISDEEFEEMVRNGRIHTETLVWKDGMDNWQPLHDASEAGLITVSPAAPMSSEGSIAAPLPSAATKDTCLQCGRGPLSPYEKVQLGNLVLCRSCDDELARYYRQSSPVAPMGAAVPPVPPAAAGALALPYATITQRAVAKIVDGVISSVLVQIILTIAGVSVPEFTLKEYMNDPTAILAALRPSLTASLGFSFLYNAALVALFGATLGKMLLHVRVSNPEGGNASALQAIIRAAVPAILVVPMLINPLSGITLLAQLIFLVGYAIALFDPQRRTLFDHLAGTRVIKAAPRDRAAS